MHKVLTFYLAFLMTVTPVLTLAQATSGRSIPSLSWQVQNLQDSVRDKVDRSLAPIIKSGEYLIDVNIQVKKPEKPNFYKVGDDAKNQMFGLIDEINQRVEENVKNQEGSPEREGKETSPEEEEEVVEEETAENKKNEEPEKDESKANIKFENDIPSDLPKDYIVFSKLGVEAPLIDDFNNFHPDGKILLTSEKATEEEKEIREKLEKENKEKIENLKESNDERVEQLRNRFEQKEEALYRKIQMLSQVPKPSPLEQLWKYNESMDVFKHISSVAINVKLNSNLHKKTRKSVNKVLTEMDFNLGGVKPDFNLEYIPMDEMHTEQKLPTSYEELADLFSKFSGLISAILFILALVGLTFLFLRKWEEIKEKEGAAQQAAAAAAQGQEDKSKDDDDDEDKAGQGVPLPSEEEMGELNGIERFRTYYKNNKAEAARLVKKWIQSSGKDDVNALRALVQQLQNNELTEVFMYLTDSERETWKSYLGIPLGMEAMSRANRYISSQIVEEIIIPSAISDEEAQDLLLKLQPEQAAKFVTDHPDLGSILLNVMNTAFVSRIIHHLDENIVDDVIDKSLNFDKGSVQEKMDEFKSKIKNYLDVKDRIPFVQRVADMIPTAGPSRESSLYRALANVGETDIMYSIAKDNFPASLIDELPENFLKQVFQRYPLGKKVEALLALSEERREYFINIFAPTGSKVSDMLEIEFEKAENDVAIQRRVRNESEEIWKEFVDFVRREIKADTTVHSDIEEILNEWISQMSSGRGGNVEQLHAS